jgi:hypothetical protein
VTDLFFQLKNIAVDNAKKVSDEIPADPESA